MEVKCRQQKESKTDYCTDINIGVKQKDHKQHIIYQQNRPKGQR